MSDKKKVIVLGGGLAGLAAAVILAEREFHVTIIERKPFLGGRASSFPILVDNSTQKKNLTENSQSALIDHRDKGVFIDNCQHILLNCCTNLLDFYRRIGVEKYIRFVDHYLFQNFQGNKGVIKGSRLPAPFHLLPSFLQFKCLSWKDRLAVIYGFFCMFFEQRNFDRLDQITMLNWLRTHGQSAQAIEVFWNTFLVSALNEDLEKASAKYGIRVCIEGLLKNSNAFQMGVPIVPLEKLYTQPCLKFLRERGAEVRLRSTVNRIEVIDSKVSGIKLNDGTEMAADYYLSSLPPEALLSVFDESTVNESRYLSKLRRFHFSPIISIYLWFDKPVTDLTYLAVSGRKVQWIFNKTNNNNKSNSDNHLSAVISASREFLSLQKADILRIVLKDLNKILPAIQGSQLLNSIVIKEPFATFSCCVGCDQIRLEQKSPLSNLLIAGDWTNTGWPPTMESAVRSSYCCAELILEAEGRSESLLKPNLPANGISRWLL